MSRLFSKRFSSLWVLSSLKALCTMVFVLYLSGCVTASVHGDGRITLTSFGVNHVLDNPEKQTFIDLQNATVVGVFADGSLTIGYKNKTRNRVFFGCRSLVLTDENTDRKRLVEIVNGLQLGDTCKAEAQTFQDKGLTPSTGVNSLQIGVLSVTQSPTFPPDKNIMSYEKDFYGLELGPSWGLGQRQQSVISSGEECLLLLVASTKNDYDFYKQNLTFDNGEYICLALKPSA